MCILLLYNLACPWTGAYAPRLKCVLPAQELDLDMLLMSVHDYFMGLGVDEIRRRGAEDDKPLRMVKTILHELCKLKVCLHFGFAPCGA